MVLRNDELGLELGSPDEVLWTDVKERTEKELKQLKDAIKVNEAFLELAEEKLEELGETTSP